jgi:hypothetical protein
LFFVLRYVGRASPVAQEDVATLWPTPNARRLAMGAFIGALVLAATGLLTRPDGLGALLQTPADWIAGLLAAGAADRFGLALSLLVYGPVTLVFGLVGAWLAARSGTDFGRFLGLWTLTGLVVGFIGGAPTAAGDAILPLTLAAGLAVGHLARATADAFRWQEDGVMVGILLIVLAYAGLQMVAFGKAADALVGSSNWLLAVGAVGLAGVLCIVYAVLWGRDVALRVAGWSSIIVLTLVAWSNGTALSYRPSMALQEPMRPYYCAPGAATIAQRIAKASWMTRRDPLVTPTAAEIALRSCLEWPLRQRSMTWSPSSAPMSAPAVVVASGSERDDAESPYMGQTYVVGGTWSPAFAGRHAFVRWLFNRGPGGDAVGDTLVKADLYLKVQQDAEGEG